MLDSNYNMKFKNTLISHFLAFNFYNFAIYTWRYYGHHFMLPKYIIHLRNEFDFWNVHVNFAFMIP